MPPGKLAFVASLAFTFCSSMFLIAQERERTLPPWAFKACKVPTDREQAVRWYLQLHEETLCLMPQRELESLTKSLVHSPEIPREVFDKWGAHQNGELKLADKDLRDILIQIEKLTLSKLSTAEIRSRIQTMICQRHATEKRCRERLARIAAELALLVKESKGTEIQETVQAAFDATGHVEHQGQVLPYDVAYPLFGARR